MPDKPGLCRDVLCSWLPSRNLGFEPESLWKSLCRRWGGVSRTYHRVTVISREGIARVRTLCVVYRRRTVAALPWMASAFALVALANYQNASAQSRGPSNPEQLHFSAEDSEVKHPITLPAGAIDIIKKDPDVVEALKNRDKPLTDLPMTWITAAAVHLDGRDETDIVIVARGLLAGANVTTFWVLRPKGQGFELLLTAPAHDLYVRNTRTNGYRDIEIMAATAVRVSTVTFKLDGDRYKKLNQRSESIR